MTVCSITFAQRNSDKCIQIFSLLTNKCSPLGQFVYWYLNFVNSFDSPLFAFGVIDQFIPSTHVAHFSCKQLMQYCTNVCPLGMYNVLIDWHTSNNKCLHLVGKCGQGNFLKMMLSERWNGNLVWRLKLRGPDIWNHPSGGQTVLEEPSFSIQSRLPYILKYKLTRI